MAIAAVDLLTLGIQQLHAAEATVDSFAEEQLQGLWRLIQLCAGRGLGPIQVGVRPRRHGQQRQQHERGSRGASAELHVER